MTNLVPPSVTATVNEWIAYAESLEAKVTSLQTEAVTYWKEHEVVILAGVMGAIGFAVGHFV